MNPKRGRYLLGTVICTLLASSSKGTTTITWDHFGPPSNFPVFFFHQHPQDMDIPGENLTVDSETSPLISRYDTAKHRSKKSTDGVASFMPKLKRIAWSLLQSSPRWTITTFVTASGLGRLPPTWLHLARSPVFRISLVTIWRSQCAIGSHIDYQMVGESKVV